MKKLLALLLALAMIIGLVGCTGGGSGSGSGSGGKSDGKLDTSKEVEIVMYFISNRPAGQDKVDDNMNKIFRRN